ncbi:MAG: nucleotidyl transferase AbiEii/AbiGii toxin family protein [Oscillospiraceae bacterium]|nr:nucleotidyl transferase AbiEii/AbiGii toxin family protein [Oscillospiraceae bacterium]
MAVKNITASVLARLRNQSKAEGITHQMGLQLFFQEEFLRKLSHSQYRENMILKGGMFIYTLTDFDSRPTRDMDFMIRRMSRDMQNMRNTMQQICETDTGNDYITIEVSETEQISLEKKYPGVRVKLIGRISNVRVPFSIDIGIDDVIVPEPVPRKITTRLDGFEAPEIYTYSLESTIAEKLDIILDRMENTTRMKDFFDIYYISSIFDFDGTTLCTAINSTLIHRNRNPDDDIFERIKEFPNKEFFITQWSIFQPAKESGVEFSVVINRLIDFLEPIYISLKHGEAFCKTWKCEKAIWE